MTFEDMIAALSKGMGAEIEVEGGFCAMRTGGGAENGVTILKASPSPNAPAASTRR